MRLAQRLIIQFCLLFSGPGMLLAQHNRQIDRLLDSLRSVPDDSAKVALLVRAASGSDSAFYSLKQTDSLLQLAIGLARELHLQREEMRAYNVMGVVQRNNSQYSIALEYHKKALAIARQLGDELAVARSLNNIGVAYRRLDENQQAFEYHLLALRQAEKINDTINAKNAINGIGNIQLSLGRYREAIEQFHRSMAMDSAMHNDLGMAINLANIGEAYRYLGKIDLAIDYYHRSLFYNQKIPDNPTGIAICNNLLGSAYLEKKDFTRSLHHYRIALALDNSINDKIHVSVNMVNIGNLYLREGIPDTAIAMMQKGLDIARQINSKSQVVSALKALQDAYKFKGNYRKAYDLTQQSLLYKDSIFNEKSALRLAEMQTLYDLDRKDNQIKFLEQVNKVKQEKYQRNWYLALALMVILVLTVVSGWLYMRHRESTTHKSTLQFELQSLRSQMNPHFIFNSLNSIHRFIWSNQQEEASEYLSKFSRLMRMILENTRHSTIILSKELQFLTLYLDLETLRCNSKFSYSISVDPAINQDELLVPPLIIQPFVENAIWHGLVHKEGQGELKIAMQLEGEMLICLVEDNGVGREKAMQIKAMKQATHQSVGIRVTEDRIKLIKEITDHKDTSVQVIDLQDNGKEALGTRVVIKLPVEFLF